VLGNLTDCAILAARDQCDLPSPYDSGPIARTFVVVAGASPECHQVAAVTITETTGTFSRSHKSWDEARAQRVTRRSTGFVTVLSADILFS